MTEVNRLLFPVGHGGFAAEAIDHNYLSVIDCGSDVCPTRVSMYIDALKNHRFNCVNRLFITHFDNDHVNCIKELIYKVGVKEVVVPFIPHEMRYVYNTYTKGAYLELLDLFYNRENEIELIEINEEKTFRPNSQYDIWEWNVKCLLTEQDWKILCKEFKFKSLDINKLTSSKDSDYLDSNRKVINSCFRSAFGSGGPNSKGLIVLSQKCNNVVTNKCIITQGCSQSLPATYTGCLYTGDANLKDNTQAESFVKNHLFEQRMLLTQIPHHGSKYNSNDKYVKSFNSEYYFYCDNTDKRLQDNKTLSKSLSGSGQLLNVRDCCMDLIWNQIVLK